MKHKYFSYCPEDGFDTHETLEDALFNANDIIPNYLDEGWSEDVAGVFVGTITHAATMCDKVERAGEVDEHGYDEDGEHWDQGWEYKCDYKMLPVDSEPAPAFSDEDHVHIPRSLIHAACSAIDKKRDGVKTLAELRRYTTGDLSRQPAPDASKLVEALKRLVFAAQCRDNSTGDQIRLIETREELSAAAKNAEEVLAAFRNQCGEIPMHPCVMQLDKVGDV